MKVLARTRLGRRPRRRWELAWLWEPRDLWFGVYWTRRREAGWHFTEWSVYVTLVPCLPVRLVWRTL